MFIFDLLLNLQTIKHSILDLFFSIDTPGNAQMRFMKQSLSVGNVSMNCFMYRDLNIVLFMSSIVECKDHQVWGQILEANSSSI